GRVARGAGARRGAGGRAPDVAPRRPPTPHTRVPYLPLAAWSHPDREVRGGRVVYRVPHRRQRLRPLKAEPSRGRRGAPGRGRGRGALPRAPRVCRGPTHPARVAARSEIGPERVPPGRAPGHGAHPLRGGALVRGYRRRAG